MDPIYTIGNIGTVSASVIYACRDFLRFGVHCWTGRIRTARGGRFVQGFEPSPPRRVVLECREYIWTWSLGKMLAGQRNWYESFLGSKLIWWKWLQGIFDSIFSPMTMICSIMLTHLTSLYIFTFFSLFNSVSWSLSCRKMIEIQVPLTSITKGASKKTNSNFSRSKAWTRAHCISWIDALEPPPWKQAIFGKVGEGAGMIGWKSVCIQQMTIYQINFLRTRLKGDDSSNRSKDAREEFKEWKKIIGWRREDEGGRVYVGVLQERLRTFGNRETSYDYRDRSERSADKSRLFLRTHCPQKWMSHKKGFIYQWCMVVRRSKNETW